MGERGRERNTDWLHATPLRGGTHSPARALTGNGTRDPSGCRMLLQPAEPQQPGQVSAFLKTQSYGSGPTPMTSSNRDHLPVKVASIGPGVGTSPSSGIRIPPRRGMKCANACSLLGMNHRHKWVEGRGEGRRAGEIGSRVSGLNVNGGMEAKVTCGCSLYVISTFGIFRSFHRKKNVGEESG